MAQPLRFACQLRTVILPWLFALLLAVGASAATKKPPLHPINLNSANSDELQQVPGIGPATADKILQMRKSYGAFKSVDDLLAIRGIGKKRLDKMRKYLTAGKPTASPRQKICARCAACEVRRLRKSAAVRRQGGTLGFCANEKASDAIRPASTRRRRRRARIPVIKTVQTSRGLAAF